MPKYEYRGNAQESDFLNLGGGDVLVKRWEGTVERRHGHGKWEKIARASVQQTKSGALRQATKQAKDYQRYFDHYGHCWHDERTKERDRKAHERKRRKQKVDWAVKNVEEILAVVKWSAKGKPHEAKAQRLLDALDEAVKK